MTYYARILIFILEYRPLPCPCGLFCFVFLCWNVTEKRLSLIVYNSLLMWRAALFWPIEYILRFAPANKNASPDFFFFSGKSRLRFFFRKNEMNSFRKGLSPFFKQCFNSSRLHGQNEVSLLPCRCHIFQPVFIIIFASFWKFLASMKFSTSTALRAPHFCGSAYEAVKDIPDGSKLLVGGDSMAVMDLQLSHFQHF